MVGGGRRSNGEGVERVLAIREVNPSRASMLGSDSGGLMCIVKGPRKGWFSRRVFLHRPMFGQLSVRLSLELETS